MKFINIEHYKNGMLSELENDIKEYNVYFNSIKNQFSKTFCSKYLKYHGFHDWRIISIECSEPFKNKKPFVTVTLYDQWDDVTKQMIYSDVRAYNVNFSNNHFDSFDTYFLDEFIKLDDSYFSHEVILPLGSSYYVEFKTVRII